MKHVTRKKILLAAIHILASKGVGYVKVRSVVKVAKTSVERFYHHFGKLESLFEEVQTLGWERIMLSCAETVFKGTEEKVGLHAIVQGVFNAFAADPQLIRATFALEAGTRSGMLRDALPSNSHRDAIYTAIRNARAAQWTEVETEFIIGGLEHVLFETLPLQGDEILAHIEQRKIALLSIIETIQSQKARI